MKTDGAPGSNKLRALRQGPGPGLGQGVKGFGKQLYSEVWSFFLWTTGHHLSFLRKGENLCLGNESQKCGG